MSPLLLPDHRWKLSYSASDDRLHEFYLPALERSVRYDRSAGFFSSSALAIAAAGVARLVRNGGRMRLLCGAELSREDVEAIRRGARLEDVAGRAMAGCLADPADQSLRARLEALAWLIAEGRLEVKVVLPRGPDGYPLPAGEAHEYYHPKEGVFEDAAGNRLAFQGSVNESATGWQHNYEAFMVFATWQREDCAALPMYVREVERRFERLWRGQEPDWVAIDIPTAARERLLSFRPAAPPVTDPLERQPLPRAPRSQADQERARLKYLRDAPRLVGADGLGLATAAVTPWPHQVKVALRTVEAFPRGFLFCEEVGLGKTVEVGAVLRQLLVSGQARRALLLVPKSVLHQWQEELYEKFALNVPAYDGQSLRDFHNRTLPLAENPWASAPVLLASSQLAKRRNRQQELLDAGPWDVVIVDEAHHARRRPDPAGEYRPNRLLELLSGTGGRPGLKDCTAALYLLTATPMQTDPVEVWDLLCLLGLGGRWGADSGNFTRYFAELRKPADQLDWEFVLAMASDEIELRGGIDPRFERHARERLGPAGWQAVQGLLGAPRKAARVQQLSREGREVLLALLRHHTPLRRFMWRHTRRLLRRYREQGLLDKRVPDRSPRNVWIELDATPGGERDLYERIDEYVSRFYQRYEAERRGLGFVMTVYRRRLTSSFAAMERSLDRRLRALREAAAYAGGLVEEDLEEDDLEADVLEALSEALPVGAQSAREEIAYIEEFLNDLRLLATDSKLEQLQRDLQEAFLRRGTVVVFTQYTDTLDYLRERLRAVYGSQVACYSGRGGEVWDGVAWVPIPKEELKEAFRQGEEIKVLLCTDAASEGLNLQTCGVLINYDMPWNPMRVEQRIGRIDRIGQQYDTVWIRNYFYRDTVEADIYQRLTDRIQWFEDVVGKLQPILQGVRRAIGEVAMLQPEARARALDAQVASLRQQLDAQEAAPFDLDEALEAEPDLPAAPPPPVCLPDLEEALTRSPRLRAHFRPHPELPGAYLLRWNGAEHAVTFKPAVFDRHPTSLQLATYGNPLLDELLAAAGEPPHGAEHAGILRLAASGTSGPATVLYCAPAGEITSYQQLRRLADQPLPPWTASAVQAAHERLRRAVQAVRRQQLASVQERWHARRLALLHEARTILCKAALVEIARGQQPGLRDGELLPPSFGQDAVQRLDRHDAPFRGLLSIVAPDLPEVHATDPYFLELQGASPQKLQQRFHMLAQQGRKLLREWAELVKTGLPSDGNEQLGKLEALWLPYGRPGG